MSDELADLTGRSDDWRKGYWDNVTGEQFGRDNSEYLDGWVAGSRDSDKINRSEDGDDDPRDDGPYSYIADAYMRTVPGALF